MSFTFSTLLSMIIINAVFVIALNQIVKTSVINFILILICSFSALLLFCFVSFYHLNFPSLFLYL